MKITAILFALVATLSAFGQATPTNYPHAKPRPTSGPLPPSMVKPGGPYGQTDYSDTYPAVWAEDIGGGYRSKANPADRDNINPAIREEGMMVYDAANQTLWLLNSDLTTWKNVGSGSIFVTDGSLTGNRVMNGAGQNLAMTNILNLVLSGQATIVQGDLQLLLKTARIAGHTAYPGQVVTLQSTNGVVEYQTLWYEGYADPNNSTDWTVASAYPVNPPNYFNGQRFIVTWHTPNSTDVVRLKWGSLGFKNVVHPDGGSLAANELANGAVVEMLYSEALNAFVVNGGGGSGGGGGPPAATVVDSVPTVADLLSVDPTIETVVLQGVLSAVDGGGGVLVQEAGTPDNVWSYPSSVSGQRWARIVRYPIDIRWAYAVQGNAAATRTAIINAVTVAGGLEVRVPPGNWVCNPINFTTNIATKVHIHGDNQKGDKLSSVWTTRLQLPNGANSSFINVGDGVYFWLEDISLDGNKGNQSAASDVLTITGASYAPPHVVNVAVTSAFRDGIVIQRSEVYLDYVASLFNGGRGFVISGGDVSGFKLETGFNGSDGFFFNGPTGGRYIETDSYVNQGHGVIFNNANQMYFSGFHFEENRKTSLSIGGSSQGNRFINGILRTANMQFDQNGSTNGAYPSGTWSIVEFTGTGPQAYTEFQNVLLTKGHPTISTFGTNAPKYFWEWKNTGFPAGFGVGITSSSGFQTATDTSTGSEFSPNFLDNASVMGNFTAANGGTIGFDYIFGGWAKINKTGTYILNATNQTSNLSYVGIDSTTGKLVKAPTPSGGSATISPNAGNIITDPGNGLYAYSDTASFDTNRFTITPIVTSGVTNYFVSWNADKILILSNNVPKTANAPLMDIRQTWNGSGVTFNAASITVTNLASDSNASTLFAVTNVNSGGAATAMMIVQPTGIISGHSLYSDPSDSIGFGQFPGSGGRSRFRSPTNGTITMFRSDVNELNFDQLNWGSSTGNVNAAISAFNTSNLQVNLVDKSDVAYWRTKALFMPELGAVPANIGTNGVLAATATGLYWRQANGTIVGPLGTGGGGGSGDSVSINGAGVVDANYNDTTPAAIGTGVNVKWQASGSAPASVSGYLPIFSASGVSHAAGLVPDPGASAGTTKFLREDATWQTVGTVTSVGITVPSWLSVSGSPVSGSGTLGITSASASANQFLASPNGSSGVLSPRAIVAADLPSASTSASGILQIATDRGTTAGQAVNASDSRLVPFVAAGVSHATGLVPDPGATSGLNKFLRDDSTWQVIASGDNVSVNGSGVVDVNLNATTPAAPGSGVNVTWQTSGTGPASVSGYLPIMGASGSSHAAGLVPDPGASAGTTKFLREDGTWQVVSGGTVTASSPLQASSGNVSITSPTTNNMVLLSTTSNWVATALYTPAFTNSDFTLSTNFPNVNISLNGVERTANKNAASGYAGLDGSSLLTRSQLPVFVGSGSSHAIGAVPDPGASAGTTKFLREDGTWSVPSAGGGSTTFFNGSSISAPNVNDTTPSINATNGVNVTWQVSSTNVSGYVPLFVKSGSTAAPGLVPAPPTSAGTVRYLREDGTWATPIEDNIQVNTSSSAALGGNFNDTTPAAVGTGLNVKWQISGSSPSSISAYVPTMIGSGSTHAPGLVPDTPGTSGNTLFLREDGTWSTPPASGGYTVTVNNGSALGSANFSSSTPAAPAGTTQVSFQTGSVTNVSAYVSDVFKVLDRNRTFLGMTNTAASLLTTNAYTFTVPANTLGTNKSIHVVMTGTFFNNDATHPVNWEIKYGGNTCYKDDSATWSSNSSVSRAWLFEFWLYADNSTGAQRGYGKIYATGTAGATTGTGDIGTIGPIIGNFFFTNTSTDSTANNDIVVNIGLPAISTVSYAINRYSVVTTLE